MCPSHEQHAHTCAGSDGVTYSNLSCGLFTAEIEATTISSPSTKFIRRIQQILIPCSKNCLEVTPLQGTASVSVSAPNATLNIKLSGDAIINCKLNGDPQQPCKEAFITETIYNTDYIPQVMINSHTQIWQ